MKKLVLIGAIFSSGSAFAEIHPSYSEIRMGFENISYSETLTDIAGLGRLAQSVDVTNPAIRQISYSGIDDSWGFYVDSAATIATDISTETWTIGEFGAVQQDAFKIKSNEIGIKAAYHWSNALQLTFGSKIFTSSFTRSNFAFVQPGAKAFDDALIALPRDAGDPVPRFLLPGQAIDDAVTEQQDNPAGIAPVISVSEDQMGILLVAGARFDSRLQDSFNDFSWYIEGEISTPLYSEVQNTQFATTTLTDSFNGWGLMARLGMRYQIFDNVALMTGVDAQYKERGVVTGHLDNGRRLRVPEVEYSNVSFTTGLKWSY